MDFTYPKAEKLKSKKTIDSLFTEGKSVGKYPLRLVFIQDNFEDDVPLKMGVSVSKKYFKKAVDRNYFKRVLRECYRKHQHQIKEQLAEPQVMLFFYQTRDRLSFAEIEAKTQLLFAKWAKVQSTQKTEEDV